MNCVVQIAVLTVISAVARCQVIETCTSCEQTYNAAKSAVGATNPEKCTAAKEHLRCLFGAYDTDVNAAGCNAVSTMVSSTESDMNSLLSLGVSCISTDTCVCQNSYLKTAKTTEYERCGAASTMGTCVAAANDVACDSTVTNAEFATDVGRIHTSVCCGAAGLQQVTLLAVMLGVLGRLVAKL